MHEPPGTRRFRLGAVIGKFYPPHRGHEYLVSEALRLCARVAVVLCEKRDEEPPGELRFSWLQELFPDAELLFIHPLIADDDSAEWARHTLELLGETPDAVFTSEDYGERWAQELGSQHVMVDRARRAFPVSGSAIRQTPMVNWSLLSEPARPYYARRVRIVGTDCTGKTTLARALARHFTTAWVPEIGRLWAEGRMLVGADTWREREFVQIAQLQAVLEDELARRCSGLLVCDTDASVTAAWAYRHIRLIPDEVRSLAASRRYDTTVLCAPDFDFLQDGTRDEDEDARMAMHEMLLREHPDALIVSGAPDARLVRVVEAVSRLLYSSALRVSVSSVV